MFYGGGALKSNSWIIDYGFKMVNLGGSIFQFKTKLAMKTILLQCKALGYARFHYWSLLIKLLFAC